MSGWTSSLTQHVQTLGMEADGDRPANIGKVVAEASSAEGTIDALLVGGVELKGLLDAKALYGPLVGVIPDSDKLDSKLSKVQEGYATGGYMARTEIPADQASTGAGRDVYNLTQDQLRTLIEQSAASPRDALMRHLTDQEKTPERASMRTGISSDVNTSLAIVRAVSRPETRSTPT